MVNFIISFKNILKSCTQRNQCPFTCSLRHYHKKELNCYPVYSNRVWNQFIRHSSSERKLNDYEERGEHSSVSSIERCSSDKKLLKIAIIGAPNSGKSTLINKLIGWRVCSVSSKVHTTQCNARAICNEENTQLVFLDTPGIVTQDEIKKFKLRQSLVVDPELSLQKADVIAVLHDVSNRFNCGFLHPKILRLLIFYHHIPSILILNKVDKVKKKDKFLPLVNTLTDSTVRGRHIPNKSRESSHATDELLAERLLNSTLIQDNNLPENELRENCDDELVSSTSAMPYLHTETSNSTPTFTDEPDITLDQVLRGEVKPSERQVQKLVSKMKSWVGFSDVFMISALNGSGIEDLRRHFLENALPSEWIFSDEIVTDQNPQEIAILAVREKCLEYYSHNIPYELKFQVIHWELTESDLMSIMIGITCRNKSHMKLLIGPSGKNVKKISLAAEQELRNTFRTEVKLKISFTLNESK